MPLSSSYHDVTRPQPRPGSTRRQHSVNTARQLLGTPRTSTATAASYRVSLSGLEPVQAGPRVVMGTASLVSHRSHAPTALDGRPLGISTAYTRDYTTSIEWTSTPKATNALPSRSAAAAMALMTRSSSVTRHTSHPVGTAAAVTALAKEEPASSPLMHLQPLPTSREADYLSLAPQRTFAGRFRCAAAVVVRTAINETAHEGKETLVAASEAATLDATSVVDDGEGPEPTKVMESQAESMISPPTTAGAAVTKEKTGEGRAVEAPFTSTATTAAPKGAPYRATSTHGKSSLISRPRLASGSAAASVVSGGGQPRRLVPRSRTGSLLNGTQSIRQATNASVREGPARPFLSASGTALSSSTAEPHAPLVPAANMTPLVRAGLHTSLWLAAQTGVIEVRSMTDANEILASLPPHTAQTVVTALTPVCGNQVVAGHTDGSLRVYDAASLRVVADLNVHTSAITRIHYVQAAPMQEGVTAVKEAARSVSLLLAASLDRTISIWDAVALTLVHRLKVGTHTVCAFASTSMGGYVFTGCDDGSIRLWDAVRGLQWGLSHDERAQLATRRQATQRSMAMAAAAGAEGDHSDTDEDGEEEGNSGDRFHSVSETRVQRTSFSTGTGTSRRSDSTLQARPRLSSATASSRRPGTEEGQRFSLRRRSSVSYGGSVSQHRSTGPFTGEEIFAPSDSVHSLTPGHGSDMVLVGAAAGISPLHSVARGGEGGADFSGRDPRSTDAHLPHSGRLLTSTKRNHRGSSDSSHGSKLSGKRPRRRSSLIGSAATGGGGTPHSPGALEQRLAVWIRQYERRVPHTAGAAQIVLSFPAAYGAADAVNWPIDYAHHEYVAALAVVEDRLLVSASCDATAKVFALPSGQYVRTLPSSRRMPLSGVLYDSQVCRLYTAFSDGGVAAYDMSTSEMPLLSLLQSPQTILSCIFVPLGMGSMRRFVLCADGVTVDSLEGEEVNETNHSSEGVQSVAEEMAVVAVAQSDKTTAAHGPNLTTSSYRVGQPSLRELNAAVSLQSLQRQRITNVAAKVQRPGSGGTLTEMIRSKLHRGAGIFAAIHVRRQLSNRLAGWQLWATRRSQQRRLRSVVAMCAESCMRDLQGRYMQRWRRWTAEREKASATAALKLLQAETVKGPTVTVEAVAREGHRRTRELLASALARTRMVILLWTAFHRWHDLRAGNVMEQRQALNFNRLFLSMNSTQDAPPLRALAHLSDRATRQSYHAKAAWLLAEHHQQHHARATRLGAFDCWCRYARHSHETKALAEGRCDLVEPLSHTLVRVHLLRRRCFVRWHDFALHMRRDERLQSERETLRTELVMLQRITSAPTTVSKMRVGLFMAESAGQRAAKKTVALMDRVQALKTEETALRTEQAVRVLIQGFRVPTANTPIRAQRPYTDAPITVPMGDSRSSSVRQQSSRASSSHDTQRETAARTRTTSRAEVEEPVPAALIEERLLVEVAAVLRALKGNCTQFARDDQLLIKAHTLALRLPILERDLSSSSATAETSRRNSSALPSTSGARPTSWVSSRVSHGGAAVTSTGTSHAASRQQQPRRRSSTISHGSSAAAGSPTAQGAATAGGSRAPTTSVTTPRSTPAQLWSAQPAEESYASLSDAFDAVYAALLQLFTAAATECGVDPLVCQSRIPGPEGMACADTQKGNNGHKEGEAEGLAAAAGSEGEANATSWMAQIPLKSRRSMIGEVLKLVTLYDSFLAHSDLPVEQAGSISLRGAANARALPLHALCSSDTAHGLLRHAAALLELVEPQLWPRQLRLNAIQDAYAAAIAELNASVSSSTPSETQQRGSTVMTRSDGAASVQSPASLPLAMQSPSLSLPAEVLEHANRQLRQTTRGNIRSLDHAISPSAAGRVRVPSTAHSVATRSTSAGQSSGSTHQPAPPSSLPLPHPVAEEAAVECGAGDAGSAPDHSASHRGFSTVSTPRSYTPRTASLAGTSAAGTGTNISLQKPYLGFRVNVGKDATTPRKGAATTISIREVAAEYVNVEGLVVEGPAHAAGLRVGDELVRFAGYAVTDLAAFNAVVSRHVSSGAELPVVVQRAADQFSTRIVVGTRAA